MPTLKQAALDIAAAPKSSGYIKLSGMTALAAVVDFAAGQGLISSARAGELNKINWAQDFAPFVSPTDTLVTNATQIVQLPLGAFIAFIEVDEPTVAPTGPKRIPMGKRHLIHTMIHLGNGVAAGVSSGKALGIGTVEGWQVVDLAKQLNWVTCTNGFDAINAVPLGIKKTRLLRIRFRSAKTDTLAFIQRYLSMEPSINSAIARNETLGDKKLKKFDVVADQILPAGKPIEILAIADWSTVKTSYAPLESKFSMMVMLAYRKRYVDDSIARHSKACQPASGQPIIKKSSGSDDLTSDYDITVGIPGRDVSGAELDVIEHFNNEVRIAFGQQPGTIFDTNLYAKDFLALNADDNRLALPDVGAAMYAMMTEGQDIGALVKQRRFMPNDDWERFVRAVSKGIDRLNPGALAVAQNRYDNAENNYLWNVHALLNTLDERAKDVGQFGPTYRDAQRQIEASTSPNNLNVGERNLLGNAADQPMAEVQLMLRHKLLEWEHNYPDLVLWVSNDLYIQRMREIRKYQQTQTTGKQGPSASDVRVADLISSAIFFAAEAYLSEGALRHIVDGVQAANANPRLGGKDKDNAINQALMDLSAEQLLQSANEQFGDFLKDFAHYDGSPEFLYRGSKYLQRLFEAANILSLKQQASVEQGKPSLRYLKLAEIEAHFKLPAAKILERLNNPDEGLVAVRKGKKTFKATTECDAYCLNEVQTYFGANNGSDLLRLVTDMIVQMNVQVRSDLDTVPTLDEVRAYFSVLQG